MSDEGRSRLAVLRDGEALPDDEARALWLAFSAHMDEHRGDMLGFAKQHGYHEVRPEFRNGRAVLIASTTAEAAAKAAPPPPKPKPVASAKPGVKSGVPAKKPQGNKPAAKAGGAKRAPAKKPQGDDRPAAKGGGGKQAPAKKPQGNKPAAKKG